jgi:hypothetical protein
MTMATSSWPGHPLSGEHPARDAHMLRRAAEPLSYFDSSIQRQQAIMQDWRNTSVSITQASPDLLALLERLYVLPQRASVLAFLASRPYLVALLLEARLYLNLYFHDVQLVLRLDEYAEYGPDQLGLYILAPVDHPDQVIAQLAAFDEGWWLDAMDRALGELFITVTAA